jgi:hypothetical protein
MQAMVALGAVARQRCVTRSAKLAQLQNAVSSLRRVAKTLTRLRRQRNIHHMMTSSGDEFFGFGAMTVLHVDQQPQIGKDPR